MARKRMAKQAHRKRKMHKKKAPTNKALDRKINRITNQIVELKYSDLQNLAVAGGSGAFGLWGGANQYQIQQGDAVTNRNANKIYACSIQTTCSVFLPAGASGTAFRIIAFWDKTANGAVPTGNSVFDTTTLTDFTTAARNVGFLKRYNVVYSKRFVMNPSDATLAYTKQVHLRFKLGRIISYTGNAGNITDMSLNLFWFGITFQSGLGAPTYAHSTRLYYKDG